jgi:branched-chain amino acid transport system substrate-binding protein
MTNRSVNVNRVLVGAAGAILAICFAAASGSAIAGEVRTIKIAGFGAKSGVLRSFGTNSEAVLRAAAEYVNNERGGIKLKDGAIGKVEISYYDSACKAEEGINVLRRIASSDFITAFGPTCSGVAEPLYGILQKKVGDTSDSGLQFPLFSDVPVKKDLAKISEWSFRNSPSEDQMYLALWRWIKENKPELKTVFGGVEVDNAHSKGTWFAVIKKRASDAGFDAVGETKWLLADTTFSAQVREMKAAKTDVIVLAAHAFTTCGVLKEMKRQRVKPKLVVGLTSSSSMETMQGCGDLINGLIIPTSFAPVNDEAKMVAQRAEKFGGFADLHSAAAWENLMITVDIIERKGILGKPDTLARDRNLMREGLAELTKTPGLLGEIERTEFREALKPFLFVHGKDNVWVILHDPRTKKG